MYCDYCFFEVRKSCLIIVAKRLEKQEKIGRCVVTVKDDRAIYALLSFARILNKDYKLKITDAVEKVGGLAIEVFDVSHYEVGKIKEEFIKHLQKELRER